MNTSTRFARARTSARLLEQYVTLKPAGIGSYKGPAVPRRALAVLPRAPADGYIPLLPAATSPGTSSRSSRRWTTPRSRRPWSGWPHVGYELHYESTAGAEPRGGGPPAAPVGRPQGGLGFSATSTTRQAAAAQKFLGSAVDQDAARTYGWANAPQGGPTC
ncbi:hypothetical protein QJS66_07020 [Kocuria rhizophila]|nr:hypothetical protein QJS66_07020 [Kocuria rhizophila]